MTFVPCKGDLIIIFDIEYKKMRSSMFGSNSIAYSLNIENMWFDESEQSSVDILVY